MMQSESVVRQGTVTSPLLEIRALTLEVSRQTILDRLDFDITPQEIHALLDEPAAGIDMLSLNHIINIIRALKDGGGSVLLITHQEEVALIADRASQLCAGRIIFSGDPREAVDHSRERTCVRCDGETCQYVECRQEGIGNLDGPGTHSRAGGRADRERDPAVTLKHIKTSDYSRSS
jgi:ABC-type multidrug transport system ATPase subunit